MRNLFANDSRRADNFSLQHEDIYFDYSKNRITAETMDLIQCIFTHRVDQLRPIVKKLLLLPAPVPSPL